MVWEKLKNIVIRHIEVMDDIYTADEEEVASSCNELLQYIADEVMLFKQFCQKIKKKNIAHLILQQVDIQVAMMLL